MTKADFQKSRLHQEGLRKLFEGDQSFIEALEVVKNENLPKHTLTYNPADPALSIALTHAHQAGAQSVITTLRELAFPPAPVHKKPQPFAYIPEELKKTEEPKP